MILLPVLFVIVEILREKISFGFPWVTFSLISSANFLIVNLAFYVGTYGLSYIIIFIFLIPVSIILLLKKIFIAYSKIYLIFSFLLIIICIFMINLRLNSFQSNSKNFKLVHNLTVSLNQLNISQFEKLNTANDEIRLNEILELISNNKNDLILFSETDYPYLIRYNEFAKIIKCK